MPKKSKTLLSDSSIISDDKEQSKTSDIDETLPLTSFPDDKEHLEQYCHYIESEEVPKQDKISLQIELNEKAPLEDIVTADGTLIHKKTLLAVDSYSTRFLKIDDQFLLAVDKIAFPEVKGGFRPSPQFKASRTEYIDWPGIVFSSTFSLNDGDENAYRKLVAAFSHISRKL